MKNKKSDYEDEKHIESLEPFLLEFVQNREQDLHNLKKFYEIRDFEAIGKIFHAWIGFCDPYGFTYLGSVARELYPGAKEGNIDGFDSYLESIENYLINKKQLLNLEKQP